MNNNEEPKLLTLDEVKEKWNKFAPIYSNFDQSMHIFFIQLLQILRLGSAKNIYEVGCGIGRLIPLAMGLKNKETSYLAIDISDTIVEMARQNLRQFLTSIPGQIKLEEYCQLNKLRIEVSEGERTMQKTAPFDRILCNLVLMITEDPYEMMRTFHKQATQDCLLGVAVTANTELSNYLLEIPNRVRKMKGLPLQKLAKNHILYNSLEELGDKTGWELMVTWTQQVPYAFVEVNDTLRKALTAWLGQNYEIMQEVIEEISSIFKKKQILCYPGTMAVFRKK